MAVPSVSGARVRVTATENRAAGGFVFLRDNARLATTQNPVRLPSSRAAYANLERLTGSSLY